MPAYKSTGQTLKGKGGMEQMHLFPQHQDVITMIFIPCRNQTHVFALKRQKAKRRIVQNLKQEILLPSCVQLHSKYHPTAAVWLADLLKHGKHLAGSDNDAKPCLKHMLNRLPIMDTVMTLNVSRTNN